MDHHELQHTDIHAEGRVRQPWEAHYPPNVDWGMTLETGPVPALLDRAVAAWPDKPAIEYRDRKISYAELGRLVDRMAAGFLKEGLGAGRTLALFLPNTPWHTVCFFAALKAGARLVHLSPLDAPRELAHKMMDSGADVVITTDLAGLGVGAAKFVELGVAKLLLVGEDAFWGGPEAPVPAYGENIRRLESVLSDDLPAEWPVIDPEQVALLQYTGGTTGMPKGAMLSHRNLTAATSIYGAWRDDEMPEAGFAENHWRAADVPYLCAGRDPAAEHCRRQRNPAAAAFRCADHDPRYRGKAGHELPRRADHADCHIERAGRRSARFFVVEDFGLRRRADAARGGPARGGPVQETPAWRLGHDGNRRGGIAHSHYRGAAARADRRAAVQYRNAHRGAERPHAGAGRRRSGRNRHPRPEYFFRLLEPAELNKQSFVDGFFLTGDIGMMDPDGLFTIVDRKKRMIISGGFNVYPNMIESAIYEHPGVEEVIVIGVPDRISRRGGQGVHENESRRRCA